WMAAPGCTCAVLAMALVRARRIKIEGAERAAPLFLLPDYRTPIHFARVSQRDFTGIKGVIDFLVGEKLMWRVARRKRDLHLFPDRVETIAGDGIDYRDKWQPAGQTVIRLVDE